MPSAKGLFHRAIIESGATIELVAPEQAARVARELLQELELEPRQWRELQTVPLATLMSAYFATVRRMNVDQMTMGFSPTVDGTAVAQHPFHPHAAAVSADVPLIIGSTRTELTSSADAAAFTLDEAGMRARVGELLGDSASRVIEVYARANPGASPSDLYFLIASDERYGAPVMKIAERRAALGRGPVYLYYFRWETPLEGGRYEAPHTVEIPFVFHNLEASPWTRGVRRRRAVGRPGQRRVARVRAQRRPEHARPAALAGVRCEAPRDDGVRRLEVPEGGHDERRRRRPAA